MLYYVYFKLNSINNIHEIFGGIKNLLAIF